MATNDNSFLQVNEDETNYFVAIHRDDRERAKAIEGRVWSPTLKRWVYPKTIEVYTELLREFGHETGAFHIHAPEGRTLAATEVRKPFADRPSEKTRLASEEPHSTALPTTDAAALVECAQELARLREAMLKFEGNVTAVLDRKLEEQTDATIEAVREVLSELAPSQPLPPPAPPTRSESNTDDPAIVVASWLTANLRLSAPENEELAEVGNQLSLTKNYREVLIRMENMLKRRLREILDFDQRSTKSLHDLIDEARETKAIQISQSHLLNAFRIQRNKITHDEGHSKAMEYLRYLHALSSLALVWPELGKNAPPDGEDEALRPGVPPKAAEGASLPNPVLSADLLRKLRKP